MKKFIPVLIVMFGFLIGSPTNYKDLDKLLLVTAVIVDTDKDYKYNIYYEGFTPTTSTSGSKQEGQRTVINVKTNDVDELIRKTNSKSNLIVSFTQNRIILFTKNIAEKGVNDFLNIFSSTEEVVVRSYLGIWDESPEKLYDINLNGEKFLGLYLTSQLNNSHVMATSNFLTTIRDFYNDTSVGNKVSILPVVRVHQNKSGDNLDIKCCAVIKDFKYSGEVKSKDVQTANFLLNKVKSGGIDADNPSSLDKTVGLRIRRSRTTSEYVYENGVFKVKKHINIRAIFRGAQGRIRLNESTIKAIEENAAKNIEMNCNTVFNSFKEQEIDLFRVQETFYRKYPKKSDENSNILKDTILEVDVKVKIEFGSDPKNIQM